MTMNKTQRMAGVLALALTAPVIAQPAAPASSDPVPAVPALAHSGASSATPVAQESLPPVQLISPARVRLDAKEARGARLASEWMASPDMPRRGADGAVKYLYGSTLPTLVCTPLEVCSIKLQAGEVVNDVHAGDTVRWRITPATQGSGATSTTLIIVKPTDAGLTTNLLVTTDRRVYTIKLSSTQKDWIPVLSFDYPDDVEREWGAWKAAQAREMAANTLPATGQNLAHLDFGFRLSGNNPSWKPVRVYSDGEKTYIQFASANFGGGEAPALVALAADGGMFSNPSEQLVNYRVVGDRYVVDKVIERAALITGVGRKQIKVSITRGGH